MVILMVMVKVVVVEVAVAAAATTIETVVVVAAAAVVVVIMQGSVCSGKNYVDKMHYHCGPNPVGRPPKTHMAVIPSETLLAKRSSSPQPRGL